MLNKSKVKVARGRVHWRAERDSEDACLVSEDCLDAMRRMGRNSVTSILTDPPYALEFMGNGWDKVLPSVDIWKEALRVLKPGGMALVFGGTRTYHRLTCSLEDAGFEIRDCMMWLHGQGFPKSHDIGKKLAGWEGYGTALKPAWEPIVIAMKSLDGTFINNAKRHGVAGINVANTRIGNDMVTINTFDKGAKPFGDAVGEDYTARTSSGRFPANVILDGAAGEQLDQQAPKTGQAAALKATGRTRPGHGRLGKMGPPNSCEPKDALSGASRFFYCAKANKRERGKGNDHPTVKPLALMQYLVRMVKMPNGTRVLDPFMGSGTTGVACLREGVRFVGMERETEYFDLATRRIRDAKRSRR